MRFAQLKVVAAAVAAVIAVSATAAFATRYSVEGPPANPPAATPGGAPAWAAGPDLNALAGVWTGQGMTAKFAYDKVTWSGPDLPLSVTMRVKLAPEKAPKEIDLIVSGGPENGRVLPGVYDLRGDTLTVCFANQNGEKGAIRPKGLGAGEGSAASSLSGSGTRRRSWRRWPGSGRRSSWTKMGRPCRRTRWPGSG